MSCSIKSQLGGIFDESSPPHGGRELKPHIFYYKETKSWVRPSQGRELKHISDRYRLPAAKFALHRGVSCSIANSFLYSANAPFAPLGE